MKSLAIVFLLATVCSALPTVTSGPQQGDDSLTRRVSRRCFFFTSAITLTKVFT